MSSVIVNGTIDVLEKALKKFSVEDKTFIVKPSEVTIIIAISDITVPEGTVENPIRRQQGDPFYRVIKRNKPYMRSRKIKVHPGQVNTDEVSFLQVLGGVLDFFQLEAQSKPYLQEAFVTLSNEINEQMTGDEGFKSYVKSEQDKLSKEGRTEQEYEAATKELESVIIGEQSVKPTDLEIWISCLNKNNENDEPIDLVLFLYSRGEYVKQLQDIAKDVFHLQE